MHLKADRSQL